MDEANNSNNNKDTSSQNTTQGNLVSPDKKNEQSARIENNTNDQKQNVSNELKKFEHWMIVLTVAGSLIALGTGIIFFYQLIVMRAQLRTMEGQLKEMESTSKQMDALINAATASNKLTERAIENSRHANELTESAMNISKQNLAIGKKSMEISNSPYLVMNGITPITLSDTEKMTGYILLQNVGSTPAYNVLPIAQFSYSTSKKMTGSPPYTVKKSESRGIIGSNITRSIPFSIDPPSKETINSLESGSTYLVAYGKVHYSDVFGTKHILYFCSIYVPHTTENWHVCDSYNYVK